MNEYENVDMGEVSAEKTATSYKKLYNVIQTLRSENGCPWDKEQTPLSMRDDLIEETFEALDALTSNDALHAKEELADVLLNATMILYMFEQEKKFTISDAIDELCEKLIRRHPHVFPESEGKEVQDENVRTGEEVLAQWDKIKEKLENRNSSKTVLDTVPENFPPILRAYKMQKKASKKGFDWDDHTLAFGKFQEELSEVQDALKSISNDELKNAFKTCSNNESDKKVLHLEEELGDAFFALVNYARLLGINPVNALAKANQKFYNRFSYIEEKCKEKNIPMDRAHLQEEDALWNEAKTRGL